MRHSYLLQLKICSTNQEIIRNSKAHYQVYKVPLLGTKRIIAVDLMRIKQLLHYLTLKHVVHVDITIM
jgi:hypothetical protein